MKTKTYTCAECKKLGIPYPCWAIVEKPAKKPPLCMYCVFTIPKWKRVKNDITE